jgi:hypothetical protein
MASKKGRATSRGSTRKTTSAKKPSKTIEQRRVTNSIADAIRIVPIAAPGELFRHVAGVPAAPPPQLSYRGGPLLTAVQVFTLFVGGAWSSAPLKSIAAQLDAFFTFVLTSQLIDQLSEYNVPNYKIQHGRYLGSTVLASLTPPASVTDAWVRATLKKAIARGAPVPKSGRNTLYFVYLPPGVMLVQGNARSCQAFCGYHDRIGRSVFYAAMPYPNCAGCLGSLAAIDALTSTSSHELCEAITDPVPGSGWYDDANGEIGDICAWQTRKLGRYTVQLEWSNAQQRCM